MMILIYFITAIYAFFKAEKTIYAWWEYNSPKRLVIMRSSSYLEKLLRVIWLELLE